MYDPQPINISFGRIDGIDIKDLPPAKGIGLRHICPHKQDGQDMFNYSGDMSSSVLSDRSIYGLF